MSRNFLRPPNDQTNFFIDPKESAVLLQKSLYQGNGFDNDILFYGMPYMKVQIPNSLTCPKFQTSNKHI